MRTTTMLIAIIPLLIACDRTQATNDTATAGSGATANAPAPTDSTPAGGGSITLGTDRQSYRAGAQVTLTITNPTDGKYTFNPCTRALERETSAGWEEMREERMCTMIAYILDPRSTRTEQTDLGADLAAGRYRVLLTFTEETSMGLSRSVRAASAPITVTR